MINAYKQYREDAVATATPEGLTLMLYDGLVKFIKQGKFFIERKDWEKAHKAIVRAQDIVEELNCTLNMDYEISTNLRSLYLYMKDRLVEANIGKDSEILDEVLVFAEELRDTWKEAMRIAKSDVKYRQMRA
jgi:flagellar protein FliS